MALPFNPSSWYWTVAGDVSRVYSSAAGDYVPADNPTFQAWLTGGNLPSKVDSEVGLGDVLDQYVLNKTLAVVTSTSLPVQQALRQAQLDLLLIANADVVHLVQGGQNSTITGTGVANYLASATNNYRSLRSQIAASTTAAQVRAIDINAGWPANP